MMVRMPTRDELRTAGQIEGLESAVAQAKLGRAKARAADPLTMPDTAAPTFNYQDMLAAKLPEEPAALEADPVAPGPLARPRGKAAVRGGRRLAKEASKPQSEGEKLMSRLVLETAGEGLAMARFGPVGSAIGASTKFITKLPATGRALAVAFPKAAKAVESAPTAAVGSAVGSLIASGINPSEGNVVGHAVRAGMAGATGEAFVPGFARAGEALRQGGYALNYGAREVVEKLMAKGQRVSPGHFSDSYAIQVMDNVASGSFFGGGRMREAALGGAEVMNKEAEAFVSAFRTFAKDSVEVQELARQVLSGHSDAFRLVAKKKYGVIDELTKEGVRVDVGSLNAIINKQLRTAGGEDAAGFARAEIARLTELGEISPDGMMTFEAAADLRSFFGRISRAGDEQIKGARTATGGRLVKSLDGAMEKSFKGVLPKSGVPASELLSAWRDANAFWRDGVKDFNSTLIRTLTKDEPRQVARAIRNNTANIRMVKRLLKEGAPGVKGRGKEVLTEGGLTGEQVWTEIQGEIITDMARRSKIAVGDLELISGHKMLNSLRNNQEQMIELLGHSGYRDANKLFKQVLMAQGGSVEKNLPGKVIIQLKQAGAISELGGLVIGFGKGIGIDSVGLLATPYVMGRLITNPKFTKWALLGLDPKTPTGTATRAMTEMMAMMIKEGATFEEMEQPPEESEGFARQRRPIAPFAPATLAGPGG